MAVKIIETKLLNDGQISFLARSDDDPTTDSWHTLTVDPDLSDSEQDALIEQSVQTHKTRVNKLHVQRKKMMTKLARMKDAI
jgi:hypothetical protein